MSEEGMSSIYLRKEGRHGLSDDVRHGRHGVEPPFCEAALSGHEEGQVALHDLAAAVDGGGVPPDTGRMGVVADLDHDRQKDHDECSVDVTRHVGSAVAVERAARESSLTIGNEERAMRASESIIHLHAR